jgi:hypothetical protein
MDTCDQTFMYSRHCLSTICADTYTFFSLKCICSYEVIDIFDKGMVQSDTSKPALIFFTARIHTTKSTVKILAANMHCKYFLKIAEVTHFFLHVEPLLAEVCTTLLTQRLLALRPLLDYCASLG